MATRSRRCPAPPLQAARRPPRLPGRRARRVASRERRQGRPWGTRRRRVKPKRSSPASRPSTSGPAPGATIALGAGRTPSPPPRSPSRRSSPRAPPPPPPNSPARRRSGTIRPRRGRGGTAFAEAACQTRSPSPGGALTVAIPPEAPRRRAVSSADPPDLLRELRDRPRRRRTRKCLETCGIEGRRSSPSSSENLVPARSRSKRSSRRVTQRAVPEGGTRFP
jgi:hypothetical protein